MDSSAPSTTTDDCPVCAKHRGEGPLVGPLVYADDLVVVSHRRTGSLGYLYLDARRHVPHLQDLTEAEAEAVGRTVSRLARALLAELDAEFVHTLVAGLAVPHFHQHVFVRHAGTPDDLAWWQPWDGAPSGDTAAFARRLTGRLAAVT